MTLSDIRADEFLILIYFHFSVYTDQGKVRALIRAALNERAMERYVLTWLSDLQGLSTHFETWALIRDIEAINLLPSIAAGLFIRIFSTSIVENDLNSERLTLQIVVILVHFQDLVQYSLQ